MRIYYLLETYYGSSISGVSWVLIIINIFSIKPWELGSLWTMRPQERIVSGASFSFIKNRTSKTWFLFTWDSNFLKTSFFQTIFSQDDKKHENLCKPDKISKRYIRKTIRKSKGKNERKTRKGNSIVCLSLQGVWVTGRRRPVEQRCQSLVFSRSNNQKIGKTHNEK